MIFLESDYTEGAHEAILQALTRTNLQSVSGYGADPYCQRAKEKIRQACQCPQADIYFFVGGSQTNGAVIRSFLSPCEGVVCADSGHIFTNEGGTVEFSGHKVMTLPNCQGKLEPAQLEAYLARCQADPIANHKVHPGMVYISHPTELGTLYTAEELEQLHRICRQYQLPLYLDGARLGYGLMAEGASVDLPLIARYCDAFYIGGTKVGALCGEALVFPNHNAPKYFFTLMKQHGALLAKGRLLGVQFDALFTDDLYFKISRHAIQMANQLKAGLREKGYDFYLESPTNQQFVIFPSHQAARLSDKVKFSIWQPLGDDKVVVRLVTSWATQPSALGQLMELL